jgi:hypothetical protein
MKFSLTCSKYYSFARAFRVWLLVIAFVIVLGATVLSYCHVDLIDINMDRYIKDLAEQVQREQEEENSKTTIWRDFDDSSDDSSNSSSNHTEREND